MKNRIIASRRGAMLLMLFVMLIVGGIAILRMVPNEELIMKRDRERALNVTLSQLREAYDMALVASASLVSWSDFASSTVASPASISAQIASLSQWGLLADNPKDPVIPDHLWGTDRSYYWRVSVNVATNSSFEAGLNDWMTSDGLDFSVDDTVFLNSVSLDDYPYQTKLGTIFTSKGRSLKITQ